MDEQQQPQDFIQNPVQTPAPGPQPVINPGQPSWSEISGQEPSPVRRRGRWWLALSVPAAVLLIVGGFYGVSAYRSYSRLHSLVSKINNSPEIGRIPQAQASTVDTPLGSAVAGSGTAAGVIISVEKVDDNPPTTGDAPSAGMRYVAITVSVHNESKDQTIVPGTFYYQTGAGKLLPTATSTGDKADYPNKDVVVTARESLDDLALSPGESDDSHYLLFQVPKDDTGGKLVWYEGYYDTSSTRLAVFDLN